MKLMLSVRVMSSVFEIVSECVTEDDAENVRLSEKVVLVLLVNDFVSDGEKLSECVTVGTPEDESLGDCTFDGVPVGLKLPENELEVLKENVRDGEFVLLFDMSGLKDSVFVLLGAGPVSDILMLSSLECESDDVCCTV